MLFGLNGLAMLKIVMYIMCTVKPVSNGHSQKDQKLVFKTNYRLMQVKSIAEWPKGAFCKTFDIH